VNIKVSSSPPLQGDLRAKKRRSRNFFPVNIQYNKTTVPVHYRFPDVREMKLKG
jgi:hypothetical protein